MSSNHLLSPSLPTFQFFSSAQQKGARAPPPPPPNMNTNTNTNTNIFPEARETRFPRFRDTNRSCDSAPAAINEGRAVNCSRLRRISERSLSPDLKLFLPSAIITIDDECQDDRTTPFPRRSLVESRRNFKSSVAIGKVADPTQTGRVETRACIGWKVRGEWGALFVRFVERDEL